MKVFFSVGGDADGGGCGADLGFHGYGCGGDSDGVRAVLVWKVIVAIVGGGGDDHGGDGSGVVVVIFVLMVIVAW